MPLACAIRILYQVISALAYLHARKLYHCAVCSENIHLIQKTFLDPIAKLANFSSVRFNGKLSSRKRLESLDINAVQEIFIILVFGQRGSGTGSEAAPTEHEETAASILHSFMLSAGQPNRCCAVAERLFALDAEMHGTSDRLEHVIKV